MQAASKDNVVSTIRALPGTAAHAGPDERFVTKSHASYLDADAFNSTAVSDSPVQSVCVHTLIHTHTYADAAYAGNGSRHAEASGGGSCGRRVCPRGVFQK